MAPVRPSVVTLLLGATFVAFSAIVAFAQFTTVLNIPPDSAPAIIGSNTQVNVLAGGALGNYVDAGSANGTSTNIEVNIAGGTVGAYFDAYRGTTVNLSAGFIDAGFDAEPGSRVNISGGTTSGGFHARTGSEILLTGGVIGQLLAYAGGTVTVNGGTVSSQYSFMGSAPGSFLNRGVLNLLSGSITYSFTVYEYGVLNVSGGTIGSQLYSYPGSVVNISGGTIGSYYQADGEVNITGGAIGSYFDALAGSTVSIQGGNIGYGFQAQGGSAVEIFGGNFSSAFTADSGSMLRIGGGVFADYFKLSSGSSVTLEGNDFQIDGQPVAGFAGVGSTVAINVPAGSILSGTFSNGTPFAFTSADGDVLADGAITLEAADLPAIGPSLITASIGPVPPGTRAGQTLVVDAGATISQNFMAGPGSTLVVEPGGFVDDFAKAIGATVNIQGGRVDGYFDAMLGSVVNFTGGELASGAEIYDGSVLNAAGGKSLSALKVKSGGRMYVTSGEVNGVSTEAGGYVSVSGGRFTAAPVAVAGSTIAIAGGVFQPGLSAASGSELSLYGAEFRVDGVPISGLNMTGDSLQFDVPNNAVLTGVLADGSPIALTPMGVTNHQLHFVPKDQVATGSLTLVAADAPIVGPPLITAPNDPVLAGLRGGQTLIVAAGGVVSDRFTAIEDSAVQLLAGGQIGAYFEAVGAQVDVSGGLLKGAAVYHGSDVNITGGIVTALFAAGSTEVDISKSAEVNSLIAGPGSLVSISGGKVNVGGRGYPITVQNGASVHFTANAQTSGLSAEAGGSITVSGGQILYEVDAAANSNVRLIGTEFLLNGAPITGLGVGVPLALPDRGGTLTGKFASGQAFQFELLTINTSRNDYFDPQAMLTLELVLAGDFDRNGAVDSADYDLWRGQFGATTNHFGDGADGNYDGVVNAADYVVWRRNAGQAAATATMQSAVPEPASCCVAFVVVLAVTLRRPCPLRNESSHNVRRSMVGSF